MDAAVQAADRGLAFVSTIVLARLLVPADFGLVAMAMSVMALIELASAFGFEVPLIQRTDPSRAHYDTAWTLRLMFAQAHAAGGQARAAAGGRNHRKAHRAWWVLAAGELLLNVS